MVRGFRIGKILPILEADSDVRMIDKGSDRSIRKGVARLVLMGVLMCGTYGPALAAPAQHLNERVFSIGFGRVADTYIVPLDLSTITLNGLNGLSALDPALSAAYDGGFVRLRAAGRPIAEIPAPALADPDRWASLTVAAITRFGQSSPAVAGASAEKIYEAVFDAVTAKLDGYSRYSGARQASGERAVRDGYGEVGVALAAAGRGRVLVHALTPNGDAQRAGLKVGDRIVAVDGVAAGKESLASLRERLRGPVGSEVKLTVERGRQAMLVHARREWHAPDTVHLTVADGIATARIDRFSAATASQLRGALLTAERKPGGNPLSGLILDLRGNPGGLLDQGIATADLFIDHGRIVSTEGRHPESWQVWDARPDDIAAGLPIVVLIDGHSASSAEVVAAALQDSGRAVVVGATSYGKGSVQTVTRLPNAGELFLTWSRFFTPAGHSLSHQGVQPTVCTTLGSTVDDILDQLRRRPESAIRPIAAKSGVGATALRPACPSAATPAPQIDVVVAKRLLSDRALFAEAGNLSREAAVAQR